MKELDFKSLNIVYGGGRDKEKERNRSRGRQIDIFSLLYLSFDH